jgi:hypothetical protein
MIETEIEKEFKKLKRKYIAKLGNKALDNTTIDIFCKSEFGSKYKGCYAQDALVTFKPGYYVFNTDVSSGPGIHWIAIRITKTTAFVYDSFARNPSKLVPILVKRIRSQKLKIISSDRSDAEQRSTNRGKLVVICGHACLAWLTCVQKFGIRSAIKI